MNKTIITQTKKSTPSHGSLRWLAVTGVLVALLAVGAATAYSAVPVQGAIVFKEGTTIDQALAAIQNYDVVLDEYGTPLGNAGISLHIPLDETERIIDIDAINLHYWEQYAESVLDGLADIQRIESSMSTEKLSQWPSQKQAKLDEIARFSANEDGCWGRSDCPYFKVAEFQVRGTVAVLTSIQSESVVAEVGWFGKVSLSALIPPRIVPEPSTWVPSEYIVTGQETENTDNSRKLTIDYNWFEDEDLSHYSDGSAFRTGVILYAVNGTYLTTQTNSIGLPKLVKWEVENVPRPILVQRAGTNGGTEFDYRYGSMQPDAFESGKVYTVKATYEPGTAIIDVGEIVAEVGTRICRWAWCADWKYGGLSFDGGGFVLPGQNTVNPFLRIVNLPFVVYPLIFESGASEIGTFHPPELLNTPK